MLHGIILPFVLKAKVIKETYYKYKSLFRKIIFFSKEKVTEVFDKTLVKLKIVDKAVVNSGDISNTIVFVGLELNHRVIKNLKYLKRYTDFNLVVLIHKESSVFDIAPEFYNSLFTYRNKFHLKRILFNGLKLKLIYGFTSKPSYVRAAVENSAIPFLFDPYDCLVVYYGKNPKQSWMQKEIVDEQYCFENASGILARNLEAKKSMKYYGVKKKNILFSDYCDSDYFINPPEKNLNEIHITYTGGIYGKHMMKSSHGIENFFDFIESMNKQKINLHIYPSPHTKPEVYFDYVEDSKWMKHLHMHKTLLQKDLAKEISKYHFGVSPHFKEESSNVSINKLELGTSLKFFNFLEAGIPILMSSEMEYMAWLVKRYNIGIVFSKEDIPYLSSIIQKTNYQKLQKNVVAVRKKLSMKANSNRLIQFIS